MLSAAVSARFAMNRHNGIRPLIAPPPRIRDPSTHGYSPLATRPAMAGITTTTVFPAIIECEPWLGLGGLPLRVHAEYFSVTGGQTIQHEPSDGRRKVTDCRGCVDRPERSAAQHTERRFQDAHDPVKI